jgi:hypothetical protein
MASRFDADVWLCDVQAEICGLAISGTTAVIALTAAAAAASAYSAYQQGQATSNMAKYNAQVADQNAQQARVEGEAQADQVRRENVRKQGAAVAALSASGADLSGSPLSVLDDMASEGALDEALTRYNASKGQTYYRNQAAGDRFNASQASSMGALNAGATLLGGAAKGYGYSLGGSTGTAVDNGLGAVGSNGLPNMRGRA